jgi:hypothetical protein
MDLQARLMTNVAWTTLSVVLRKVPIAPVTAADTISDVEKGQDLLKRACRILVEYMTSVKDRSATSQICHEIAPYVLRKAPTIATLGYIPPASEKLDSRSQPGLSMMEESKLRFHLLVRQCFEVIRLADFAHNVSDDDPTKQHYMTQLPLLLDNLKQWRIAFTMDGEHYTTDRKCLTANYLMFWEVCYISLSTCLSVRQTDFDIFGHHFAQILEHASFYINNEASITNQDMQPNFEAGATGPLYFCATKCRQPALRRRALHLLQQAAAVDVDWAFPAAARVAARVITLEEGGLQCSASRPSEPLLHHNSPPEERRFAHVSLTARMSTTGKYYQALELNRFEVAKDGSRQLITEYAWLNAEQ